MENFPKPILRYIFSFLSFRDVRISRTCNTFHKVLSSFSLQLQMIENSPPGELSLIEELKKKTIVSKAKAEVKKFSIFTTLNLKYKNKLGKDTMELLERDNEFAFVHFYKRMQKYDLLACVSKYALFGREGNLPSVLSQHFSMLDAAIFANSRKCFSFLFKEVSPSFLKDQYCKTHLSHLFYIAALCGRDESFLELILENIENQNLKQFFLSEPPEIFRVVTHTLKEFADLVPAKDHQQLKKKLNRMERRVFDSNGGLALQLFVYSNPKLLPVLLVLGYENFVWKLIKFGIDFQKQFDQKLFFAAVFRASFSILEEMKKFKFEERITFEIFRTIDGSQPIETINKLLKILIEDFGAKPQNSFNSFAASFFEMSCKSKEHQMIEELINLGMFPSSCDLPTFLSLFWIDRREKTKEFIQKNLPKIDEEYVTALISSDSISFQCIKQIFDSFPPLSQMVKRMPAENVLKLILIRNCIDQAGQFVEELQNTGILERNFIVMSPESYYRTNMNARVLEKLFSLNLRPSLALIEIALSNFWDCETIQILRRICKVEFEHMMSLIDFSFFSKVRGIVWGNKDKYTSFFEGMEGAFLESKISSPKDLMPLFLNLKGVGPILMLVLKYIDKHFPNFDWHYKDEKGNNFLSSFYKLYDEQLLDVFKWLHKEKAISFPEIRYSYRYQWFELMRLTQE